MSAPMVPWLVVRRVALARAMAIRAAGARREDWDRLSPATRERLTREEERALQEWTRAGVVIQFLGEYREADRGGEPIVQWVDDGLPIVSKKASKKRR